jgi:antitoxin (DNA-binding transcriptional repressor) of toxin-antitoxin stability system
MKAVGIKALKDNLSRYLKLVRQGETVWVTDRDEVIAEIHSPTLPLPDKVDPFDAFLNNEERAGRLTRAKKPNDPDIFSRLQDNRWDSQNDILKILDENRNDRDVL